MKYKAILILLFVLVIVIINFILGFFKTYDPINTYNFNLSLTQLKSSLYSVCGSKENCELEFSNMPIDTLKQYVKIKIKTSKEFFIYDLTLLGSNKKAKINLIGAFDMINKSGGCLESDKRVIEMVEKFENEFINTSSLIDYLD